MPLVYITDTEQINSDHIESVVTIHTCTTAPVKPRHRSAKSIVDYHQMFGSSRRHPRADDLVSFQLEIDAKFHEALAGYKEAAKSYAEVVNTTYKITMTSGREYTADRAPTGEEI